jgi:DNA-binding FadR family transcriptional regulator
MTAYLGEPAVFQAERLRFDKLVAAASDSPVLEMLSSAVASVAESLEPAAVPDRSTRAQRVGMVRADQELYDALAAHDPDFSEAAMAARLTSADKRANAARRDLARRSIQWTPISESSA